MRRVLASHLLLGMLFNPPSLGGSSRVARDTMQPPRWQQASHRLIGWGVNGSQSLAVGASDLSRLPYRCRCRCGFSDNTDASV